jgi:transcriptional regulator with XRE-family HTH domain
MGRQRLTPDKRAAVIEARQANPNGSQEDFARASGVSRATMSRIETGDRRRRGVMPCEP